VSPDRIARLLLVGRREGGMVSLEEAARILGVDVGEVGRAVERLAAGELGVPPFLGDDVASLVVKGGWIEVDVPDELGAGWPLHAADAACMIAALRAVRGGLPRPLRARCDDLVARLAAAVDPEVRAEADERARALAWAVSEAIDPEVVGVLAEAAERREAVRLTVYNASRDAVQVRDVLALVLLQHGEAWYLCGRDPDDGRLRWWRVDRVLGAERTGVPHRAEPPTDAQLRRPTLFDPPARPLEVVVRFDAGQVARSAAWFDGEGTPTADGGIERTIRTPTLPVLLRRLLAYGVGWEVVGPEAARVEVARWAGRMAPEAPGAAP
jgi:predicted DNA-binding transcriptional regulator YafY